MSAVMKVIAGIPQKGNTISRHRKALKGALLAQGVLACSLGAYALTDFINDKKTISGVASIGGSLICLHNITAIINTYKMFQPEYNEIVKRAKQIFKK